jgi:anti-sigma factor RsiW
MEEMPCSEFVERATEYLEGALEPDELARLEAHLPDCSFCDVYLEQIRTTQRLAALIADGEPRPGIDRSALLEAYRTWIVDRDAP